MLNHPCFYLAPLRGLTGKEFRQALTNNFSGLSYCMMPFFSVTENISTKFSKYHCCFTDDELSHKNNYTLIPQIIGNNPKAIADFSVMLRDNGYPYINLNLGCPMPQITKKTRGSGLLPHPDLIRNILDHVSTVDNIFFSVKLRLGLKSNLEIIKVIEVLNDYPLNNVTIHPRLASDRYEGVADLDAFANVMPLVKHDVIYNGDIVDVDSFNLIAGKFPAVNSFMIGRGLLYKPFLIEEITRQKSYNYDERIEKFQQFYNNLIFIMKDKQNYMSHIKAYWLYFKDLYVDGEERYRKITRT